jgi:hypothetical protein
MHRRPELEAQRLSPLGATAAGCNSCLTDAEAPAKALVKCGNASGRGSG